jgi:hypothetical protein
MEAQLHPPLRRPGEAQPASMATDAQSVDLAMSHAEVELAGRSALW